MVIESLNIGLPKKEIFQGKEIVTGIRKNPVSGPCALGESGFEGDGVGDRKNHGGLDKAVCVYSFDYYFYWNTVLGTKLIPAAFGENLSVSSLREEDVCIGDVFQLGDAVVQISQPRQPCSTLAARHGRNDMVKLVVDSGRTGFYFRVMKKGMVKKGDVLMLKVRDPLGISVSFANHIYHHDRGNREAIKKVLAVSALSNSWQRSLHELLEKCK
ncbi:MAG: MOSC domain-containing protein [Dissulfurispiraceae bacterium]